MFRKIIDALASIDKDKWIHFTVCLVLSLMVYSICIVCGLGKYGAIPAFVLPFSLGVLKEIYDKLHGGEYDAYDIAADFIGCFVALIFIALT